MVVIQIEQIFHVIGQLLSSMAIDAHLMEEETVLEHCVTDQWAWVATNQRIIKFRESNKGVTDLRDISYEEISGVRLRTEERNDTKAVLGGGFSVIGLFGAVTTYPSVILLSLIGIGLLIHWYMDDDKSYFEFRGSGLIQEEPQQWRIKSKADSDDARQFVKTVRSQL